VSANGTESEEEDDPKDPKGAKQMSNHAAVGSEYLRLWRYELRLRAFVDPSYSIASRYESGTLKREGEVSLPLVYCGFQPPSLTGSPTQSSGITPSQYVF